MNDRGPIYEVTLSVELEAAADIDSWLAGHIEKMLDVPGLVSAENFAGDARDNRITRVTCYRFESEAHLNSYLETQAGELRQHTKDKFGDSFTASRRILRDTRAAEAQQVTLPRCLNCDAPLVGQYCGRCGQRATSRLISIWQLVRDAFGDLLDADSRIWQTLVPLAIRPGKLTYEYLRGRRARFLPPFRMYIVLSFTFFLLAFFDPHEDLGILFASGDPAQTQAEASELSDEILAELAEDGIGIEGDGELDCQFEGYDRMPPWLTRRVTKERLVRVCTQFLADPAGELKAFTDRLIENIPVGLFVLLPMMALVLKALYPLSRRFYVEHLVFVIHYHSFVFLALSLLQIWSSLVAAAGLPSALENAADFGITVYIPIYLYRAMRRVYPQHALITLGKLLVLETAYLAGLSLILAISAVLATFSGF